MKHAIGFVDLAEKLDPHYDWAQAYARTGTEPHCIVGFTICEYGSKRFVSCGDAPVAMLKYVDRDWTVTRYDAERGSWLSEVPHKTVAAALDHLLDVMHMFLSARDIEGMRRKVRAHTRVLNEMARNRQ